MSCWRLRLPPAKKAWKSFTSKLQRKLLRNLQYNSKAIKKPKTHRLHTTDIPANSATTGAAISVSPSPFLQQRKTRLLQPPKPNRAFRLRYRGRYYRYPFKKKAALAPAPVYIDRLFKEPAAAAEIVAKCPVPIAKNVKQDQDQARAPGAGGTSNNNNKEENACSSAADEMWESLALASPQMNGIDQRAEDFIQKFRDEMDRQEMMARRL
ncbi:DUF761 domain-containing protein [Melia azedarach]|uniref:DUF761 domain-containing protein n=1 Tax=Melia azedarach TaxID=155640 RepID=A0ACC1YTT6_MELAZ|nr:DUF761 domain-containing protein [Melia azedarach]